MPERWFKASGRLGGNLKIGKIEASRGAIVRPIAVSELVSDSETVSNHVHGIFVFLRQASRIECSLHKRVSGIDATGCYTLSIQGSKHDFEHIDGLSCIPANGEFQFAESDDDAPEDFSFFWVTAKGRIDTDLGRRCHA